MSGVRGRSGARKGQRAGLTNNPHGRPPGSKNKVSRGLRERIVEFAEGDFDVLVAEMNFLSPKDRVRAKIDILKLVIPRPVSEEEKNAAEKLFSGLERLFGRQERED